MIHKEHIEANEKHRKDATAKGIRMCCHLERNVLCCTNRTEAEIYSQSGNTDSCSLHLFDMLEDGTNYVYVIEIAGLEVPDATTE